VTDSEKPFLAYLPFQAIHIPVQAPEAFIEKYQGRYDAGWDVLREERHQRAQALGLVTEGAPLAPMPDHARPWASLSPEDQRLYAARMEVNAAMMDAMDHHVGRFVDYLSTIGELDRTIFVITSDNGPEPSRGDMDANLSFWMSLNGYHVGLEGLGGVGSWGFIGPEWATAAAAPGALFKFYATEGGIRAPLIISGPGLSPQRIEAAAMVTDITPTLLDWIGAPPAPETSRPIRGRSLMPLLTGAADAVYAPDEPRAIEVSGNAALYLGDYKITRSIPPVGDGQWRLFNMVEDPGETRDLSAEAPDALQELLVAYDQYAEEMGVLEMPAGYDSTRQIMLNMTDRMWKRYRVWIGLTALVLIAGLFGLIRLGVGLVRRSRG
jgi:arylsulfatase/uncharacterized sulfatase